MSLLRQVKGKAGRRALEPRQLGVARREVGRERFHYGEYRAFGVGRRVVLQVVGVKREPGQSRENNFYGQFRCSVNLPTD